MYDIQCSTLIGGRKTAFGMLSAGWVSRWMREIQAMFLDARLAVSPVSLPMALCFGHA